MGDEEILAILESIDRRLALLTAPQEREMRLRLEQDLLRTDARAKMFDSIDGRRTSPEIAKAAGVSERAAQLFVKELLEASLVRDTGSGIGRAVIVEQDSHALAQWFVRHAAADPT